MKTFTLSAEYLSGFSPLQRLSRAEMELLLAGTEIQTARKGECILELGSDLPKTLYILDGRFRLSSLDGRVKVIDSSEEISRQPISHLVPHRYRVECVGSCSYIWIDNRVLDNLASRGSDSGETVENLLVDESLVGNQLFQEIYQQLSEDRLDLPMMPDIALRVREHIGREENFNTVEKVILTDPALAAHLIRVANSVIYFSQRPVETVREALIRIGSDRVMDYVFSFSIKKLFMGKLPGMRKRMRSLWLHSTEVAAISFVIADGLRGFDRDHAMLLGLLHDIGMLPILSYLDMHTRLQCSEQEIDRTIEELHGALGGLIMEKWHFAEDFSLVARHADDWYRNTSDEPDYCDLVVVSQLLSFFGKRVNRDTPPVDERKLPASIIDIPAYGKLGFPENEPQFCFDLLHGALNTLESLKRNLLHS